jgi:Protein of unknown function (DUF3040)
MPEDRRLTVRERTTLDGMECLLSREDPALTRRLRSMRLHTPVREAATRFARWPRTLLVAFLAGITLALLLAATLTEATAPVMWVCAISWIATLLTATWPAVPLPGIGRRKRVVRPALSRPAGITMPERHRTATRPTPPPA